jgi:hypothetical protein
MDKTTTVCECIVIYNELKIAALNIYDYSKFIYVHIELIKHNPVVLKRSFSSSFFVQIRVFLISSYET